MKPIPILVTLLFASLCYNVYQYSTCNADLTPPDECAKTAPFNSAIEIGETEARGYCSEFVASLQDPDNTTGGVISRAAFDEMFCLEKCNGLTYAFARDISGKTGPHDNGIFIIFQGANIEYDANGNSITAINPINGAKYYRSGNWCPLNCMAW